MTAPGIVFILAMTTFGIAIGYAARQILRARRARREGTPAVASQRGR